MPGLKEYRKKRDPKWTPEPYGEETPHRALPPDALRDFVVQQHAARRMHWDLRLEIEGVLVSWAVPKGPTLDPKDKRLAVQTEDHPIEYADFEGLIPAGNYGAGAMIVWDRGAYRSVDGKHPAEGLQAGKLDLELFGHKLRGRFALVRTRSESGRDWLLIKKGDPPADGHEPVRDEPESVFSGLSVEELRDRVDRNADVRERLEALGARRADVDPRSLRPILAHSESEPFSRKGWLFELKYDGARVLAHRSGDGMRLVSRAGADRTHTYPEVTRALEHLPLDAFVLDGEVVALDATGRGSFERIQRRWTQTEPEAIGRLRVEVPVVFYAFDVLLALGYDLRELPLVARKQVLSLFVPRNGIVRFADHVEGEGVALFEAAREHGLEGIVAKRADSPYATGARSRHWLKVKVPLAANLVVVGVLPGKGSRKRLGSLMLAWHRGGGLVYAGNVGSGFDERTLDALVSRLDELRCDRPAFANPPDPPAAGSRYVTPQLVCEIRYTEVTSAGSLRQPVFVRLRDDVSADECVAPVERGSEPEGPAMAKKPPAKLELTRLEKIFWPVEGYTKGDLLAYYEAAWPWIEPYLKDRPVVLVRYPDGIEGKHFYQQNAPDYTPDWVTHEEIDGTDYFICNELRTLLYVINSGAIPLHVWSARLEALDRPDWLILDLDPKEAPFEHVVELARTVHHVLEELGAPHFAKTSGQAGMHVLLPLEGQLDHDEARQLAEVLARVVCAERPDIATVARPIAARGKKVYLDYLQNGRGKLVVAPLSVRPRAGAPVSMPLTWRQVTKRLDPKRWNVKTALARLEKHGDPLARVLGPGADVERLLEDLGERLASATEDRPQED